jgi:hypothetical protein
MRLSSFLKHVNAIEQLPRSTSNTDRTTSLELNTTPQRLQDDILDTIEAISI